MAIGVIRHMLRGDLATAAFTASGRTVTAAAAREPRR